MFTTATVDLLCRDCISRTFRDGRASRFGRSAADFLTLRICSSSSVLGLPILFTAEFLRVTEFVLKQTCTEGEGVN